MNKLLEVNNLDTDFCAEVAVATLIEKGLEPDKIRVVRQGIDRRAISKDVEKVRSQFSNDDLKEYFHVYINRESIYDTLPESIFHRPIPRRHDPDKEDVLEEIKIHRQEEFFARRFFHLFEQCIDQVLVETYLTETRFDHKIKYKEFVQLFVQYWPVMKLLEHRQAVVFMHFIPLLYKIRAKHSEVEASLSYILGVPVQIQRVILPGKKAESSFESKLGKINLGVDVILGSSFNDGLYDLKITIGPISANRMRRYLKTAHEYLVLEKLCELFLPGEQLAIVDFIIDPTDSVFTLSDENQITYLGINSFI